jgi:hypothetical protein
MTSGSLIPAIQLSQQILAGGKGQKSIPITGSDGKQVYLFPGTLAIPYNPSAYPGNSEARVNLCYVPTDSFREQIQELDAVVKQQLQQRLKEIFGPQADAIEKTDTWYQSPLKISTSGYESIRTKANMESGKNAIKCWNTRREMMSPPADWTVFQANPKILVRGVWIMNKQCGLLLDTVDVQLEALQHTCPF